MKRFLPSILIALVGLACVSSAGATVKDADYTKRVAELRKKAGSSFTVLVEKPFVVIGDETPAMVKRRAEGTVRWAVTRLKRAFFKDDPDRILEVWLFKDNASYRKHAKKFFNDEPDTPYGYYSHTHGALVMNIATGGGTLVHEIVHPYMAVNFPQCPAWLNEGMGSLYEQSSSRNDEIVGMLNWRLPVLQRSIRDKKVNSTKGLMATSDREFYDSSRGSNYAQARYLCYYLQEKGLLRKFYHAFHKNFQTDPTGYETFKQVTKLKDSQMAKFDQSWQLWVLSLKRS